MVMKNKNEIREVILVQEKDEKKEIKSRLVDLVPKSWLIF